MSPSHRPTCCPDRQQPAKFGYGVYEGFESYHPASHAQSSLRQSAYDILVATLLEGRPKRYRRFWRRSGQEDQCFVSRRVHGFRIADVMPDPASLAAWDADFPIEATLMEADFKPKPIPLAA